MKQIIRPNPEHASGSTCQACNTKSIYNGRKGASFCACCNEVNTREEERYPIAIKYAAHMELARQLKMEMDEIDNAIILTMEHYGA